MIGAQFSDKDFETLSDWLGRRGKGLPISSSSRAFSPRSSLPRIRFLRSPGWGGKHPDFKDLAEMNRFVGLVMRLYNSIVLIFETSPGEFEPTFYERKIEGKTVFIVDEWCWGFMKGLKLDTAGWKPLKRDRPDLLKPLQLFGTSAGFRELDAGGADNMHALWSPRIEPAVCEIYAFWLPHRRRALAANGGHAPVH